MNTRGEVVASVRWDLVTESRQLLKMLRELTARGVTVEVAAEPTGTYAEPWCAMAQRLGLPVYRVSTKHSHDYQEIYDGVPSSHDAKAAAIVASLHREGRSRPWASPDEQRRELRAGVDMLDWATTDERRWLGRLEALVARHWPELAELLHLKSMTAVQLLMMFGGPAQVVVSDKVAAGVMRRCSRGKVSEDRIARVIDSAQQTIGVPATAGQCEQVQYVAQQLHDAIRRRRALRAKLEAKAGANEPVNRLSQVVGACTAAVLYATMGEFDGYGSVRALLHAAGVNLKEHSSGQSRKRAGLSITKRGSATARRWLFLATLRWIKADPIARAWHQQKIARNGGIKLKGVIALMRKLLAGLYHVARGQTFDASRLFDTRRLQPALLVKGVPA
jgi:transposase